MNSSLPEAMPRMQTSSERWSSRLASVPLVLLALGGVALLWQLIEFWGIEPAYGDRLLIPLASGWLIYRLRDRWAGTPVRPSEFGWLLLLGGVIIAPPVWNLVAQVGTRTILIWWYALAFLAMVFGYLLVCWGWHRSRILLFPVMFILFALPLPQRVHDSIQGRLQETTTVFASEILIQVGVTVERQGFQLHLPSGDLEVVEACSGIRSVTALLAIAALVAYLRGIRLGWNLLFFVFAFPIIALGNVFRIVLTGLLQEAWGARFIHDFAHDFLGIAVILLGFGMIVGVAKLFPISPSSHFGTLRAKDEFCTPVVNVWRHGLSGFVLLCTLIASVICYGVATTEQQQRVEQVQLDLIPLNFKQWQGQTLELSEAARLQLAPERALRRHYQTSLGQEAEAWVMYWSSTRGMRGYHHPDICWPNHGWSFGGEEQVRLTLSDGTAIPLTIRRYRQKNREQMVCYWNQEGRRIWTREDDRQLQQTDSLGLVTERLFQRRQAGEGRLAFLVAAELGGNRNYSARSVLALTTELAESVYQFCPWAKP